MSVLATDILGYCLSHWAKIVGTIAGICTTLSGSIDGASGKPLVGEPWHHVLTIVGIIAVTILSNQTPAFHTRDPVTGSFTRPSPPAS